MTFNPYVAPALGLVFLLTLPLGVWAARAAWRLHQPPARPHTPTRHHITVWDGGRPYDWQQDENEPVADIATGGAL